MDRSHRRVSLRLTQAALVIALVFAVTGGALAATHYLITSTKQFSPNVLKSLRGARGRRGTRGARGARGAAGRNGTNGTNGTNGINGQAPAIAVTDPAGFSLGSASDTTFHSIATLTIPAAGSYTATAKVGARAFGGSGVAQSLCTLTAHTTAGGTDDVDTADASLDNSGTSVEIAVETISLQVTHVFSGPGTINLSCQQNGLTTGGAFLEWNNASVIATQVTSVTSTAVTS
jgi:hypothetical protein